MKQFIKLKTALINFGIFSLIVIVSFSHPYIAQAYNPEEFVTSWTTNVDGAVNDREVVLQFLKQPSHTYEVSWNCNDDFQKFYTSRATHTYDSPGTYDICIKSENPLRFYAPDLAADEKAKLQEIKQWGYISWSSFMSAFKDMTNMQITATDTPDLSAVTDMSFAFNGATNFTGHDSMDGWNTSSVKNMAGMFGYAPNFNAPIGNWDTSAVTAMNSMFYGATNFNQYIGKWKTGEVGNMSLMFFEATNFNNGEAPGESTKPLEWDTSKAFNFKQMFNKASSFNQPIGSWQTGFVRDMYGMFAGADVFNQNIGGWNTGGVINMGSMFNQAYAFNQNIGGWNTGAVTNMSSMFRDATAFNNGEAPGESSNTMNWNTQNVDSMAIMFRGADAFNQYIGGWDTGLVTNMSNMFQGATNFNNGEAPGESSNTMNWDTESLQYVTYMFLNARAFNQNIGSWDTSGITGMLGMFMNASSFNQNLNNWDTRKVTSMMHMFNGATVFNNGDVAGGSSYPLNFDTTIVENMYAMFVARDFNQPFGPKWTTANVKNMSDMFRQARSFNQYIGDWDTAKVENMAFMFQNANVFNNGAEPGDESNPLNWDTTKVKSMAAMFNYANQFNQPFGDDWNTTNVTNMTRMFDRASQFNQDISSWNISKVEYFNQFLNASNMQIDNYDNLLNAWSEQTVKPNLTFDAIGINYCYAEDARNKLENTYGWTITDAGKKCPPQNIRLDNDKIDENTTEVGTVTSDAGGTVTYSFVSGEGSEDNTKFAIDSDTDVLAFLEAPDYEDPKGHGDPDDANKYTIRVRATDTSNNLYSETIFIITVLDVDDVPPVITIVNPETKISNQPITVTFTVSDRYSVDSVEADDSSTATAENIVCDPNFPYDNPSEDPENNHLILNCTIDVTGSGELVIKATDKAGNFITESEDGFVIDLVAPEVTIDSPVTITSSNQDDYTLSGGCTSGDNDLLITIDGQPHTTVACDVNSKWNLTVNLSTYDDGQIEFSVKQSDLAGNITTATETLLKNTSGPNLTFNTPSDLTSENQSTYIIEGTCSSTGTSDITITWDDGDNPVSTWIVKCQDNNNWQKAVTSPQYSHLTNINIKVSQTNDLGNTTQITKNINADTQAPSISLSTTPNINANNKSNFTVSGTCSTHSESGTVKLAIASIQKSFDCIDTDWSQTFDLSSVNEDSPIITLTQSDYLNTSTITQKLYRDIENTNDNEGNSTKSNKSSKKSKKCKDQAPGKTTPIIYSAVSNNSHSVLLSFNPADEPVEKYVLQYGTKPNSYPHEIKNLGVNSRDIMTYRVNMLSPNTTYYFRIKAVNGCASGGWSNEISVRTNPLLGFNQLDTVSLDITTPPDQSGDELNCQTYTVKSGDSVWSISKHLLGSGTKFQEIIDQNSDEYPPIKDNLIKPGWTLKVNCPQDDKRKNEPSTTSPSPESDHPGFKVQVRVVDNEDNPIQNAKVTIHSKVQESLTNSEGIAEFHNVEPGEHRVIISYSGFQGEQSINLAKGNDVKVYRLDIVVKKQKLDISLWLIIFLTIIIFLLIYRNYREKQKQQRHRR